MRTITIQIRN